MWIEVEGTNSRMVSLNGNWLIWKPKMEDILYNCLNPLKMVESSNIICPKKECRKLKRKAIEHLRQWLDNNVFHHVSNENFCPFSLEKIRSIV